MSEYFKFSVMLEFHNKCRTCDDNWRNVSEKNEKQKQNGGIRNGVMKIFGEMGNRLRERGSKNDG